MSTAVPAFDADRARNLAKYASEFERFEDHKLDFKELVENNSRSIVDESQEQTAQARYEMGYTPTITRTTLGETCDWCNGLAGTREYNPQTMSRDIFARHRNCDCLIELNRNGGTEVVDNYTRTNSDVDPAVIAERLRLTEQDPNNRGEIAGRIVRGEYSLKQKHQKYLQHVKDSPQYKSATQGRKKQQSYLTISERDAQKLIYKLSGTGIPYTDRNGNVGNKEYVDAGQIIGYYSNRDRVFEKTSRVAIHYDKNGAHIVPVNPGYGGDNK